MNSDPGLVTFMHVGNDLKSVQFCFSTPA